MKQAQTPTVLQEEGKGQEEGKSQEEEEEEEVHCREAQVCIPPA